MCMKWMLCTAATVALLLMMSDPAAAGLPPVTVIDEDFQDDAPDCSASRNFGCAPVNTGKAGTWHPSGHVVSGGNADNDWTALVQNQIGAAGGSGTPSLDYLGTLNPNGIDTGVPGVFNMDGIIEFSLPDGTPRPAVTGDKIVGSYRMYQERGAFGFGFTDDIAQLQAFQATMPDWNGSVGSPVMMPTAFNTGGWEDAGINTNYDAAFRGFSPNVTGHIQHNDGANRVWTHAVVDMDDNGVVDFGAATPKTAWFELDPMANPPINQVGVLINFEYTVGNSVYDLLTFDAGTGPIDFVQCAHPDCVDNALVPNPGGPMPVGAIKTEIVAMFITGANGRNTSIWADDFFVEIIPIPEPASLALLSMGVLLATRRRRSL